MGENEGRSVAPADDTVPDIPKLPPGSPFAFLEGRLHEIFDPLPEADIQRVARFGERCSYPDGAMLFEVGKQGSGMILLLSVQPPRRARAEDPDLGP